MSWNLGNTTVRNPARIQAGLRLFAQKFNGDCDGRVREAQLWDSLTEEGIVKSKPKLDKSVDGRKWRSCFTKLGFITGKPPRGNPLAVSLETLRDAGLGFTGRPYELTPIGKRLIEVDTLASVEDIFFRQLLRLEIPSPIEKGKQETIKPLILVLQVLYGLQQAGAEGLNRAEIAAFLQTVTSNQGVQVIVGRILGHRKTRDGIKGKGAKRQFDLQAIEKQKKSFHPKSSSLVDYADTTFRYSRLTGLLALQGSRLVIRPENFVVVEKVLETEPQFLAEADPLAYLTDLYTGTKIPTDQQDVALQQIKSYETELQKFGIVPVVTTEQVADTNPQTLQDARNRIEEQLRRAREETFADNHASDVEIIDEIIEYLEEVKKKKPDPDLGIDDAAAYLEWAVWRALLTMNSLSEPVYKTRNFLIDADLRPVGNAPSRKPDMVMYYDKFLLVTEVTLLQSSRQEAAEGEPVRRHVYDVFRDHENTEVFGLFIAPRIDPNTAETFRRGSWIDAGAGTQNRVQIVPITIDQLIQILRQIKASRKTTDQFRNLLTDCLKVRDSSEASNWLTHIESSVNNWALLPN